MRRLLRGLSAASFVALLVFATLAYWAASRSAQAVPPSNAAPRPTKDAGSSGVDAGSRALVLDPPRYMSASKSLGGLSMGELRVRNSDSAVPPPAEVQAVIRKHRNETGACFAAEAERGGRSELSARFLVGANGAVTEVDDPRQLGGRRLFSECLLGQLRKASFPKPAGGAPLWYELRFVKE